MRDYHREIRRQVKSELLELIHGLFTLTRKHEAWSLGALATQHTLRTSLVLPRNVAYHG
jgi:hypothetical protein